MVTYRSYFYDKPHWLTIRQMTDRQFDLDTRRCHYELRQRQIGRSSLANQCLVLEPCSRLPLRRQFGRKHPSSRDEHVLIPTRYEMETCDTL
jgi:hypothetical protein